MHTNKDDYFINYDEDKLAVRNVKSFDWKRLNEEIEKSILTLLDIRTNLNINACQKSERSGMGLRN